MPALKIFGMPAGFWLVISIPIAYFAYLAAKNPSSYMDVFYWISLIVVVLFFSWLGLLLFPGYKELFRRMDPRLRFILVIFGGGASHHVLPPTGSSNEVEEKHPVFYKWLIRAVVVITLILILRYLLSFLAK
jgi:hypothetical protein